MMRHFGQDKILCLENNWCIGENMGIEEKYLLLIFRRKFITYHKLNDRIHIILDQSPSIIPITTSTFQD